MLENSKKGLANNETTFCRISYWEKIWGTFTKFEEKNVLCEKGDEITYVTVRYIVELGSCDLGAVSFHFYMNIISFQLEKRM
jgi:hypothetical protein